MTSNADFKRRVRERMARTGESYTTARTQLLGHRTLHVTNGDSTVATLAQLGIEALPWRDALHEGPVLPFRSDVRAKWMGASPEEFARRDQDVALHDGSFTLWFEDDLYEGGDPDSMLRRAASLLRAGVRLIVLLALSDDGAPGYDHQLAAHVAALGAPVFACTPDQFPEMLAAALEGRDVNAWAADEGINVA